MRKFAIVAVAAAALACSSGKVAPAVVDASQVQDAAADSAVADAGDAAPVDAAKVSDAEALPDGAADAVDAAEPASDTASSDALVDSADAANTADGADTAGADGGVPVAVGPGEPGGTWQPADGCVVPSGAAPVGCGAVTCPADKVCASPGTCVPSSAFWVEPAAPADQSWAAVAARDDGAYAVAWSAGNYFTGKQNIWLRLFAQGSEVGGAALPVSATDTASNLAPSVAALANGAWLVLWRADLPEQDDVQFLARKVAADGSVAVGPPFQVNQTALSSATSSGGSNIIAPLVVRLRNGRLLMAWAGAAKGGGAVSPGMLGIYARLFDPEGQPLGGELETGGLVAAGASFSPAIAPLAGGQVLLVWEGPVSGGKGPRIVRGRAFGDQGLPLGPVLTLTPGFQDYEALPAVAGYLSGETLLTYKAGDNPTATSAVTVRGRLLGADLPGALGGTVPAAEPSDLDFDKDGTYPGAAAAATLSAQRAMAVWHNVSQQDQTLWARRHYRVVNAWDCEKTDLGGPKLPSEVGARYLPALASWENGKWVLAFSTQLTGLDQYRVAVRLGSW